MYHIKFVFRFFAITLAMAPASVLANTWSCTNNNLVRTVSIEYADSGGLPCYVNYTKEAEGAETQSLWSAENLEGYCEEKAEEFVAKLTSWGWDCTKASAASEPEEVSEPEAATEPEVSSESGATSETEVPLESNTALEAEVLSNPEDAQ